MRNFERALKLEPGRTAFLVVDMQRGFLDPGEALEVPQAREIVPAIQRLLAVFRRRRLPVVFTEFVYSERVPVFVGELHPEHKPAPAGANNCLEGHPSVETVPALAPRPNELVVRKHWYDAFHGTPLDGALRARGVHSLVVTGMLTDTCVLATVVGAFNREYRITVVEDAVATPRPEIQRATLDIIGRAYGRVVSSKDIADEVTAW